MHDERENRTSLLKYEVCILLMVWFGSKQFSYDSITVIKLPVRFANHLNGLVNCNLVQFGLQFSSIFGSFCPPLVLREPCRVVHWLKDEVKTA